MTAALTTAGVWKIAIMVKTLDFVVVCHPHPMCQICPRALMPAQLVVTTARAMPCAAEMTGKHSIVGALMVLLEDQLSIVQESMFALLERTTAVRIKSAFSISQVATLAGLVMFALLVHTTAVQTKFVFLTVQSGTHARALLVTREKALTASSYPTLFSGSCKTMELTLALVGFKLPILARLLMERDQPSRNQTNAVAREDITHTITWFQPATFLRA